MKVVAELYFYIAPGSAVDRLIRLGTGESMSHVELRMPNGDFLSSSPRDNGVRAKRFTPKPASWHVEPILVDEDRVQKVFADNRGKGYDFTGAISSPRWTKLLAPFGSQKRMFCSEFCATALGMRHTNITPFQLFAAVAISRQ